MSLRPVFIGIAGGSGSGKTTVCQALLESQGPEHLTIIEQDSYYKDLSHLSFEERQLINFDHPFAFDNDLLYQHLQQLLNGQPIEKPVYNFTTHTREPYTECVAPNDIIVLEGILVLDDERIRELMDIKVYVDTDADVRILRRLTRDINERGRTLESVIRQYLTSVRPMHLQFVEPSKRYADIIIPEGGHNTVAIDLLNSKLKTIIAEKKASN